MNLPPIPKNPMFLQPPNYERYVFFADRSGIREYWHFANGYRIGYFKLSPKRRGSDLMPDEVEKLGRNLWKEMFGNDPLF